MKLCVCGETDRRAHIKYGLTVCACRFTVQQPTSNMRTHAELGERLGLGRRRRLSYLSVRYRNTNVGIKGSTRASRRPQATRKAIAEYVPSRARTYGVSGRIASSRLLYALAGRSRPLPAAVSPGSAHPSPRPCCRAWASAPPRPPRARPQPPRRRPRAPRRRPRAPRRRPRARPPPAPGPARPWAAAWASSG